VTESDGRWIYEYALQNLNSDQSAGGYTIPIHPGARASSIGFHDVAYHSGDPYDGTDWPGVRTGGEIAWATTPFGTNVNANAIRWGTLYNFRVTSNAPPERGTVTIGLFKPSVNASLDVEDVWVPTGEPVKHVAEYGGTPPPPIRGPGFVPLSSATPRTGQATLPLFAERTPARIGHAWEAGIAQDAEGATSVERSLVFVSFAGADSRATALGEVLIASSALVDGSLAIPNDPRLIGRTFSAQAAVKTSEGWRLTNALDVTIAGAR
jgi:hypothetical protein